MLQYQIESVTRNSGSVFTLQARGWLADTEGRPTDIRVVHRSGEAVDFSVSRTARPDVGKLFENDGEQAGFELNLCSKTPEEVKIAFSAGKEEVVFDIASLEPFRSGLTVRLPLRMQLAKQLKGAGVRLLYLITLPLRLLRQFKNGLFRVSPAFRRFYMKHIYALWAQEPPAEPSLPCPFLPWGEHLLLFSHFADGTGAPLLALNIARELRGFGFNLHIVLLRDGELQLGPFQGKTACTRIPIGKGVCGTAVAEKRIIRVADVHTFPGHIACDSASASEIVLPIYDNDRIIGVLDIDSPVMDRFDDNDEEGLSRIVHMIEANIS